MEEETIKSHIYIDNMRHKEKELKKVKLTAYHEGVREHLFKKFNFKKASAQRGMWGRRRSFNEDYAMPKMFHKEYYNVDDKLCSYIVKTK